ncbi:MAG: sensor histidine kinase [Longimicrobiales bacterium]
MIWNRVEREAAERGWHADPQSGLSPVEPPIEPPALQAAATTAADRLLAEGDTALAEQELRALVDALARAVADELPGPPPGLPGRGELHGRAICALRGELVRGWERRIEAPEPAEMLPLLHALGVLEEAVARATRENGGPYFPDGADFVAGVAHDLRSPLTSILFLAETLLSEQSGEVNDVQRRQLGIIYSAALGLVSVASDIIELVRGGDGLKERRAILFSVTEMMESVHDIVRPMAEEKGLRVQLFPPAVDQRFGYPLALSRVLLNLTTNGLKFTESGFVEISVRALHASRVEFSVRDTGKGYTPDAIDNLYQPFRRSRDGKKYGFSGTGLGLAISRKLVTAMGSTLEVESRPGWGTRFFFELELPARTAD